MKHARTAMWKRTVLLAALMLPIAVAHAFLTMNGTIPPTGAAVVVLQPNNQSNARGVLKFKFTAPTPGAYSLNFCIGPVANPCGTPTSFVVVVPGGQERLALVDAEFFASNELVVSQGTNRAVAFSVMME